MSISVHEAGKPNSFLFQGLLELGSTSPSPDMAQRLANQVNTALRPGKIGAVYADTKSSGLVINGSSGTYEEKLFLIGSSAVLDYVGTDLVTFSDAWMPYDLKGRPQPALHAANAPRLSAALLDLSEVFHSEADPDEPTYFGKPTETGVENYYNDEGTAADVWGSFEIQYRYDKFTHAPGFGRIGFKRSADGEVAYVPVLGEHGVLGYLWASDTENAASFEPRDVGDEETYRSGLLWLDRLRLAHDRGLSPSQALTELAGTLEKPGISMLDLASLRELRALGSGRHRYTAAEAMNREMFGGGTERALPCSNP
ncbi:hypothetical protein [Streptomyces sp. NBC_00304]|uniref:hypothetical protein n=1 Tax=Streptomyces sp. NBC_00304 TaxID=2975706 RepID=UPI002E29C652|nr:hypothetical protein [Streptomyces sp. NBC_00304]